MCKQNFGVPRSASVNTTWVHTHAQTHNLSHTHYNNTLLQHPTATRLQIFLKPLVSKAAARHHVNDISKRNNAATLLQHPTATHYCNTLPQHPTATHLQILKAPLFIKQQPPSYKRHQQTQYCCNTLL